MRLQNEIAVVTGGGSGIGKATAELFASEGAAVVVVDREPDAAQRVANAINAAGGKALPFAADLSDESQALSLVPFVTERCGGATILVNNAGVRVFGLVTEATQEDWDIILGTNLRAIGYCCKALIPVIARSGGGSIVNVSSANAIIGRSGMPLYDATKAGVLALTRAMAVGHAAEGIRVNAVCPGPTITGYHLRRAAERGVSEDQYRANAAASKVGVLNRHAEPIEIAYAILFLASREASYITGETLMVDGGMGAT